MTSVRNWGLAAAASAGAAALLLLAVDAHVERACTVLDTPYLPLCPTPPTGIALQQELHARISANPGDAWAWTALLVAESGDATKTVLRAAAALAPNHGAVLRRRAAEALQGGNAQQGVDILVQMVAHRGSGEAGRALAQFLASPESIPLLRPHLGEAPAWLPSVIAQMAGLKIPATHALPLVAEAMQNDRLPPGTRRSYMRALKAGGYWLDAYGLWLVHQKQAIPLLYNGSFNELIEPDGFDWEFSEVRRSRTGVVVEQRAVARRGMVLDIEFTGRTFRRPIARQYVFVPPGAYRLRGEYMASKLRSEGGLAWQVVCTSGQKATVASSAALVDTGGVWKPWQMDFEVPADCGTVASVQLEPAAAFEARTGIRGRVAFDNLGLARVGADAGQSSLAPAEARATVGANLRRGASK
jgi:hypothetical protein